MAALTMSPLQTGNGRPNKRVLAAPTSPLAYNGVNITPPTPGSTPLYTPGGNISSYIQSLQKSQDEANQANQQRYQQGLGVLSSGMDASRGAISDALSASQGIGTQAYNRINEGESAANAHSLQSSINRGLGNTTIQDSLYRGNARTAEDARQGVDEQLANRRINLNLSKAQNERGGAGDIANFISARNDTGPDAGLLAGLVQGAASYAGNAARSGTILTPSSTGFGAPGSPSVPSFGGGSSGGGTASYFTGSTMGGSSGGGGTASYFGGAGLGTGSGSTVTPSASAPVFDSSMVLGPVVNPLAALGPVGSVKVAPPQVGAAAEPTGSGSSPSIPFLTWMEQQTAAGRKFQNIDDAFAAYKGGDTGGGTLNF
jgi:hypothetical protein